MFEEREKTMPHTGMCECGSTTYTLIGNDPVHVYVCHCLDCQTRSGSAFSEYSMVPLSRFVCNGPTVGYVRKTNSVAFAEIFCSDCHSRIYGQNDTLADAIFLRAGTLTASQYLEPIAHIWTKRKQPWVLIPEGIPSFAESPTPHEFGLAIQQAQRRRAEQGYHRSAIRAFLNEY